MKFPGWLAFVALAALTHAAHADIKVGVTLSATGPAASLGIPERNTFELMPTTIAGHRIEYIILDDASDTTTAVKNTRRFVSEEKVDVVVGSTITPNSLAMIDIVAEAKTPMISMAASARIVEPVDEKRRWVFKTAQDDRQMADAILAHMSKNSVRNVAFIGFADAYGEGWWQEFDKSAKARGIRITASERYNRTDTFVTGQILKMMRDRPDAILIAASGTPAALPQKTLRERGYRGTIYQTHGVANADFLRVGGKDVEGTILPAGPVLVADALPADNAVKKVAMEYVQKYEAAYGKDSASTFGAHAWDAGILLQHAIPVALKTAKPGTPQFRAALRDALEGLKDVPGAHGVFNMSATDHLGFDRRAAVMVEIRDGNWELLP